MTEIEYDPVKIRAEQIEQQQAQARHNPFDFGSQLRFDAIIVAKIGFLP